MAVGVSAHISHKEIELDLRREGNGAVDLNFSCVVNLIVHGVFRPGFFQIVKCLHKFNNTSLRSITLHFLIFNGECMFGFDKDIAYIFFKLSRDGFYLGLAFLRLG